MDENGNKITLLVDTSHYSIRMISVCKIKEPTKEEGYQTWKYWFLKGLFDYIDKFKADEVILAVDSDNNFRKDIFPYYKAHRKIIKEASDTKAENEQTWFNWVEYFELYHLFLKEIKQNLPFKIIEVDRAEGDDVIGILSNNISNPMVVVTSDSDYIQLVKNQLVRIWNPLKKEFVIENNPKNFLLKKIMMGDTSDFIPSIQDTHTYKPEFLQFCVEQLQIAQNETNAKIKLDSEEKTLYDSYIKFYEKYGIKPSRCRHFTEKMAMGIINTNTIKELLSDSEVKRKFMRNNKLINLTEQPQDIKDLVISEYKNYKLPKTTGLFKFFLNNRLNQFLDDIGGINQSLISLS